MEPSKYQTHIYEKVAQAPQTSLIIDALAGSGKTTTIVKSLDFISPNESVLFCAFNKHIADELALRAPAHVSASTLHSLGLSNIRSGFRKVKVNKWKNSEILNDFFPDPRKLRDAVEKKNALIDRLTSEKIISLAKANLCPPSIALAAHYGEFAEERHVSAAIAAIERATEVEKLGVDFDDMIYLCAIEFVKCEKFTTIVVDEAQDLNESQISMLLKSRMSVSSRIIAVGDPFQSIYGFRGASGAAMQTLSAATQALELPLSICYRCATNVVKSAQKFVPQIEWWENSPAGIVDSMKYDKMLDALHPGDYVLCRVNAPLFSIALNLIKRNIKPTLRGKDLAKQLSSLARRLCKNGETLSEFAQTINEWRSKQLENVESQSKRSDVIDRAEVLLICAAAAGSPSATADFIESLFEESRNSVTLSSIHRAKGLEADRVFWLQFALKPEKLLDWELPIEQINLPYVATTRAKRELYYVELPKQS